MFVTFLNKQLFLQSIDLNNDIFVKGKNEYLISRLDIGLSSYCFKYKIKESKEPKRNG